MPDHPNIHLYACSFTIAMCYDLMEKSFVTPSCRYCTVQCVGQERSVTGIPLLPSAFACTTEVLPSTGNRRRFSCQESVCHGCVGRESFCNACTYSLRRFPLSVVLNACHILPVISEYNRRLVAYLTDYIKQRPLYSEDIAIVNASWDFSKIRLWNKAKECAGAGITA